MVRRTTTATPSATTRVDSAQYATLPPTQSQTPFFANLVGRKKTNERQLPPQRDDGRRFGDLPGTSSPSRRAPPCAGTPPLPRLLQGRLGGCRQAGSEFLIRLQLAVDEAWICHGRYEGTCIVLPVPRTYKCQAPKRNIKRPGT